MTGAKLHTAFFIVNILAVSNKIPIFANEEY